MIGQALLAVFLVAQTADGTRVPIDTEEAAMLARFNRIRIENNLVPCTIDPILQRVARHRAPFFDHQAFGCWSWDEAWHDGFRGPVTDNLAQGHANGTEAVQDLTTSPGHFKQMLGFKRIDNRWVDQRFNVCGLARHGRTYIMVFGRRETSGPPAPAAPPKGTQ